MKKILKTFSFLVALAAMYTLGLNTAQAQDAAKADSTAKKSKLMIGVRAGLNINYLRVANSGTRANGLAEGAHVGVFVKYAFNNWVSASLEAAWSQTGSRNMAINGSTAKTAFLQTNAVQLNPIVQFKLPVLSVYEPYLFAGPSFNLNTISTAYVSGSSSSNSNIAVSYESDATDAFNTLDFGLLVGAGVDFNLRFATLTLDARYRHGLSDVNYNSAATGMFGGSTWRSSGASFQVGLGFPIGGK